MAKEIVLIPHCVRDLSCMSNASEKEMLCMREGCKKYAPDKCAMYSLITEAEKTGREIRIAVSEALLPEIVRLNTPSLVLGLACEGSAVRATAYLDSKSIPSRSTYLTNRTCFKETKTPSQFSLDEFIRMLNLTS